MINIVRADGKSEYKAVELLKNRNAEASLGINDTVSEIIADVKANQDKALIKYNKKFDGVAADHLEVTKDELFGAVNKCDKNFINAIVFVVEDLNRR